MSYKDKLQKDRLPIHVAIIMDGNGRWAKARNKERIYGHHEGAKSAKEVVEAAVEVGIGYLTLYAFSSENWRRPKDEVDALMSLLVQGINDELNTMAELNVRLKVIGDLSKLDSEVKAAVENSIEQTKNNSGLTLIIALSYGSREEIIAATREIARKVKQGVLSYEDIDKEVFEKHLYTADLPDPDLLIRTSGEQRISNFLLWQLSYTELYFTETLWPDFRKEQFYKALYNYQNRERRFGKTSEQLKETK